MALSLLPVAVLIAGAWRDIATRTIPDLLPLLLLACGVALRGRAGIAAVALSLALAALCFAALVALHARGWLGGGDVKLLAGTACGLAPATLLHFLASTAIAGGVLAALYLLLRRLPAPPHPAASGLLRRIVAVERWRIARRAPLPYAVAIAGGGVWTLLLAPMLHAHGA